MLVCTPICLLHQPLSIYPYAYLTPLSAIGSDRVHLKSNEHALLPESKFQIPFFDEINLEQSHS